MKAVDFTNSPIMSYPVLSFHNLMCGCTQQPSKGILKTFMVIITHGPFRRKGGSEQ